jgi:signal transduction histidine kinase
MLLVIHLLQQEGPLFISLAIFSVIYLFATFSIAYKFSKVTRQKNLLDKENEALVQQLKNKKKVAEKANADKSRFLASASHDLRQPLQVMNLFAEALKEQITDPKQHSLLHKLRTSMEETDNLLDSLLDMSKLDAGLVRVNQAKFLLFPILHKLEKEFHLQASNKSLSLSVDTNIKRVDGSTSHITADEIIIQSDPILLKNILSNLLSNAIKYTQQGKITISCLHSEHGYIVYLKDTGIGIAENERDNVFDAFYQVSNTERNRSKGIGLGLSIVKHLCKLLEHQIIMHSQPGVGTTFEIHIPSATEVSTPHQRHTLLHNLNATVLVVDDETAILEGMQAMLTPWGCTVITAQSLDETLVLLKKERAVDLLLVDYRLQHNQVGTTMIHQARKLLNKPDLPAIIISGDTEPKRMQKMEREGFEVLHKPIKPAQLRSLMNHLLK